MSQMTISCPHCTQQVLGDTAYAGQALACPNCGGEFVMPGEPDTQPHNAPAPQLKRTGRPQLKRPGVAVRQGPATSTTARTSALGQRQSGGASQQVAAGSQRVTGAASTSGLLYQAQPGFGRLWADPVTGQRDACDGMGPGKSLLFGLLFLFVLPLIAYLCVINGLLSMGMLSTGGGFGRRTFLAHLMGYSSIVVLFALVALSIWVFRLMCAKKGRFGEILLVTGFAFLWVFVFMFLAALVAKGGSPFNPSTFIMVLSTTFSMLAGFAFCLIIYGAFRNLSEASGAASFWLAPTSVLVGFGLFIGYVWIVGKIMS